MPSIVSTPHVILTASTNLGATAGLAEPSLPSRVVSTSEDVYVGPTRTSARPQTPTPPQVDYGWSYRLKQYGTDALVIGGATLAMALLLSPEPFVSKILGAIIAIVCIVGGTIGKHYFFKEAYLTQALEKAVGKLGLQIDKLDGDIHSLEVTRHRLESTNESLEQTREGFEVQVSNLKTQVNRLKVEVSDAFSELNTDRAKFESQKKAKLDQLNDEIEEANARGDSAQRKLDDIYSREAKLNAFERELDGRRANLVSAEAKLEKMQASLLRRVTGH